MLNIVTPEDFVDRARRSIPALTVIAQDHLGYHDELLIRLLLPDYQKCGSKVK